MHEPRLTDRQQKALAHGKQVEWVADAFKVPRPELVAAIAAQGWVIDPATDRAGPLTRPHTPTPGDLVATTNDAAVLPGGKTASAESSLPAAAEELPASRTADGAAESGDIEQLLNAAHDSGNKRIVRAAGKVTATLEALRALYVPWKAEQEAEKRRLAQLAEAEAQVAALKERLAEAEAAMSDLRPRAARKTAAPRSTGRTRAADIRAWAADRGVACPERGRIPGHLERQYDAAHPDGARDAAT
ncbi:Lsr2 family DNA-binding protein [Spirillospora sp. CA-294931]|uniref:Lsr2 family DNA-binding protein n=1 Tax=Spirillospora sp. CA-294931 TaxID=3240042 RepID=UPI003D8A55AE